MDRIPESVRSQINHPQPDIDQFLKVIRGQAQPSRAHLAELFADQEMMAWITEHVFEKKWVPAPSTPNLEQAKQHLLCEIEYWYRMGYDYIRVSGGLYFATSCRLSEDTADLTRGQRGWTESRTGPIQNWDDFNRYPWPVVTDDKLWMYDFVARNLPDGMGLMICPTSGFLEMPLDHLLSYEALALMAYDNPELVKAVFDRVRECIVEVYRRVVDIPRVVGFFQGDDMGFRSGTLMSPAFLKSHSLPGHKTLVDLAHAKGKIYFLHACGNLEAIMDYLIDEIGSDAKHSFEDTIMPVEDAFSLYGQRIGILGGLDVDILARGDEQKVRTRTRRILDRCMANGRFALGSGNTITNYCKPENVLAMFDEAYRWR